jgi:E2F-associated phosphoprotein
MDTGEAFKYYSGYNHSMFGVYSGIVETETDATLSCPLCFITVCYQCQRYICRIVFEWTLTESLQT